MSRFYGGVKGNRGEVTRCGSKDSGMSAFVHGWNIGAHVRCYVDPDSYEDRVAITIDGGTCGRCQEIILSSFKVSNGVLKLTDGKSPDTLFGIWKITENGLVLEPAA